MILSELIPFLEELGASPKKSLSQNFLIDPNIVKKIIHTAEIKPGDLVLEIGPGPGALTAELLKEGASVFAIEKDTLFAKSLARLQTNDFRLRVADDDALTFPLSEIAFEKVVANLPYHITTPILERLFTSSFRSLTLMVQKEFGQRLLAKPGTKDFSSLTLFGQFYTTPKSSFIVSPGCFYPRPSIDSVVIRLDRKDPPLKNPEPFFQFARKAFQQRRKMLSTSLQEFHPAEQIKEALHSIGIRSDARPEMLGLEEWLSLFATLTSTTDP